jgi:membrane protease YdiL (CAAX protease family)
VTLEERCPACGAAFKLDAAFCSACGRRRREAVEPGGIGFTIGFYVAMLALQIVVLVLVQQKQVPVFSAMAVATGGLAAIVLVAALSHRRLVAPLYRRAGFSPFGYALILLAAPVIVVVVSAYVHGLGHAFDIKPPRELDEFEGHGLAIAIVLVAIAPPVIEELAFRGLIFGSLAKTLRRTEVYAISSFAFAMLHLSVPSLLTHLPLGLYFCWLRDRSGSLYPSMFAHFCHNLGVLVAELNGWW